MSLPTPYYDEDGITIYHGDCREILPHLPKVDLVLTDPPYGIDYGSQLKGKGEKFADKNGWRSWGCPEWDKQRPSPETIRMVVSAGLNCIMWGGNYFADVLPPTMGWLVWNKMQRDFSLADGELAWTSFSNALRIFDVSRASALLDGKEHPTQKSLEVIKRAIGYADRHGEAATILDPFMGSGTTLRAAKDLGRKAIGIEIEEKYCEIAVKRLAQGVLAL